MAEQMMVTITDSRNYREMDDKDVALEAQQLINGALEMENYQPIKDLEKIKLDSRQALVNTHFSTPEEKVMAERLHHNTDGWIETAKDALSLAINFAGLVTTCGPTIHAGVLHPDDVTRATQHAKSMSETLKRMYNRACDMAMNNSNELLLAIEMNENISQNLIVKTAMEQHRNDLKRFQKEEVNVNVPYQSHAKLLESIKQTEFNEQDDIRAKSERSRRAWNTAIALGAIVLAVGVIIGMAILKR